LANLVASRYTLENRPKHRSNTKLAGRSVFEEDSSVFERDCIIVHGCPSGPEGEQDSVTRSYDKHWIPWVREKLIARDIPTLAPVMPDPWTPDYARFKRAFETHPVSSRTILIGHSCGCAFLVRWLGESKQEIDTLVLVAPWKVPRADDPVRAAFYDFAIDETIKGRVRRILMFTSDTEKEDGRKSLAIFHAALQGEVVNLPHNGHYTVGDMGGCEFPELLDKLT
jgi:predicted alpha/beta hydrolase family esterase